MTVFNLHQTLAAPSSFPYPECLSEWRTSSYRVCSDDGDGEHCECGKRIWHVFSVEHISGATIPRIGSKCIKQFDSEFATQAHGLERLVKRAKAAAKRAADAAHRAVATVEANRDALRVHQEARHQATADTLCTYKKHMGEPWTDVMSTDPSYCGWLLTSGRAGGDLKEMFLFFRA